MRRVLSTLLVCAEVSLVLAGARPASAYTPPLARAGMAMAYFGATGFRHVYMFGGQPCQGNPGPGCSYYNDLWYWCGAPAGCAGVAQYQWKQVFADGNTTGPCRRRSARMAYVDATINTVSYQYILLFGGFGDTTCAQGAKLLSDTWKFDGTTWTSLSPTHHPSAREGISLAFDRNLGEAVLFSGATGGSGSRSDTWVWDPAANGQMGDWLKVCKDPGEPGNEPACVDSVTGTTVPSRNSAAASWDGSTGSGRTVVYGGWPGSYPPLDDMWGFTCGAYPCSTTNWTWTEVCSACTGTGRTALRADWFTGANQSVNKVVLFGGTDNNGHNYDDTLTEPPVPFACVLGTLPAACGGTSPSPRLSMGVGYDGNRVYLVMFGGVIPGSPDAFCADTWTLSNTSGVWSWTRRDGPAC